MQRLSSALFGQELLAVEAARVSAAERERMLEGRVKTLFEAQVENAVTWLCGSKICSLPSQPRMCMTLTSVILAIDLAASILHVRSVTFVWLDNLA